MMARSTHNGPALDVDQAAVTDLQPNQPPEPDPALTQAPAQPPLLQEASCTSTCT